MELKVEITYKSKGVVMVSPIGAMDTTTYAQFAKECAVILEAPVVTFILNMEVAMSPGLIIEIWE